jgi:hypothetical protein
MRYAEPRSNLVERYVTQQTAPTYAETVARALQGDLSGDLSTEETVQVLLRTVRALYLVTTWLADELDQIEAAIAAR